MTEIKAMTAFIPQEDELPRSINPYWAATSKGWMVNIPALFGEAHLLTKEEPVVLKEYPELFHFNGKKLPAHIMIQAHDFFRKVWNKQKTESSAYICYNAYTQKYKLFIPEQYVTAASVEHKLEPGAIKDGYYPIGTAHSHCDFSAYHSSIDTHDMEQMPGIHITIGHVDQDEPEYAIAIGIGKTRFDLEWDTIIDDEVVLDKNGYDTAPDWWLEFVHTGHAPWETGGKVIEYKKPRATSHKGHQYQYGYQFPKSVAAASWEWYADFEDDLETPTLWEKQPKRWGKKSEKEEAFELFEAEVTNAEDTIDYIVEELANYGFALSYTIHYSPAAAQKYLDKLEATEMKLLPELTDATL